MSQRDKTIKKMKNNPKGWRIDDCKSLADHFDIAWVQDGSSHLRSGLDHTSSGSRSSTRPATGGGANTSSDDRFDRHSRMSGARRSSPRRRSISMAKLQIVGGSDETGRFR